MHVWVYDVMRETLSRLTIHGSINYNHFWTPDGRRIVFSSGGRPDVGFFAQSTEGSGGSERLCCDDSFLGGGLSSIGADGVLAGRALARIRIGRIRPH
jgi:hypothetical protein